MDDAVQLLERIRDGLIESKLHLRMEREIARMKGDVHRRWENISALERPSGDGKGEQKCSEDVKWFGIEDSSCVCTCMCTCVLMYIIS